jgi:hypothetical protein
MDALEFLKKNGKCTFIIDSDIKDIINGKNTIDKMIKYNKKNTHSVTKIKKNTGLKSPRKLILEYVTDNHIKLYLEENNYSHIIDCWSHKSGAVFNFGKEDDKILKFMAKFKLFKPTATIKKTTFLEAKNGNFSIRIVFLGPEHTKIKKSMYGLYAKKKNNHLMSFVYSSWIDDGSKKSSKDICISYDIKASYTCIS